MATWVKRDPKAPFSIATTPKCRGGRYSIPRIAPLYPWSSPFNIDYLTRRHQASFFESLVWLDLGLNLSLPDHWRTLNSLGQCGLEGLKHGVHHKNRQHKIIILSQIVGEIGLSFKNILMYLLNNRLTESSIWEVELNLNSR